MTDMMMRATMPADDLALGDKQPTAPKMEKSMTAGAR